MGKLLAGIIYLQNNVHYHHINHTKDRKINIVTHTDMDIVISPPNHLPNQGGQPPSTSTLQFPFLPPRGSREQGVPSLQLRGIKPLENVRGAETLPQSEPRNLIQPQINNDIQSPDNECIDCAETEISETLSLGLDHFSGLGLDHFPGLGLENTHFPGLGLCLEYL